MPWMPQSAFGPHLMTAPITGKTHRTATFLLLLVELFVSLYPSCLAFPNLQTTYASRINNGTQRKFQIILDCVSRSKRSPQYNLPIQSLKRCATLDVLLCNWTNSKYKRGGFQRGVLPTEYSSSNTSLTAICGRNGTKSRTLLHQARWPLICYHVPSLYPVCEWLCSQLPSKAG